MGGIRIERAGRWAATLVAAVGGTALVATPVRPQSKPPAAQTAAQPAPVTPAAVPEPAAPTVPAAKTGDWPRVLKPSKDLKPVKLSWSDADIQIAQHRCLELLKGLDVVAVGAPPMRENDECGAPAPIELISIGKNPEVTLSPTVTVTCDMAAAMHQWVTRDLQPLAKKHLGTQIIRLETMSSYSCRNAYGRTKSRLSEHGRANAIDIRSFITAKASAAEVLVDWGPTQRDIQAKIAAAKAEAARIEAAKAETAKAAAIAAARARPAGAGGTATNPIASGTIPGHSPNGPAAALNGGQSSAPSTGMPGISIQPKETGGLGIGLSLPAPSRLGGPKAPKGIAATEQAIITETPASRTVFLKQAHETACKIFGTVLGPEANNAHRNHFHVDMAPRTTGNFCE